MLLVARSDLQRRRARTAGYRKTAPVCRNTRQGDAVWNAQGRPSTLSLPRPDLDADMPTAWAVGCWSASWPNTAMLVKDIAILRVILRA
jgi:hypothetical protein